MIVIHRLQQKMQTGRELAGENLALLGRSRINAPRAATEEARAGRRSRWLSPHGKNRKKDAVGNTEEEVVG